MSWSRPLLIDTGSEVWSAVARISLLGSTCDRRRRPCRPGSGTPCPRSARSPVVHSLESSDSSLSRVLEVRMSGSLATGANRTTSCSAASIDATSCDARRGLGHLRHGHDGRGGLPHHARERVRRRPRMGGDFAHAAVEIGVRVHPVAAERQQDGMRRPARLGAGERERRRQLGQRLARGRSRRGLDGRAQVPGEHGVGHGDLRVARPWRRRHPVRGCRSRTRWCSTGWRR